MTDERTQKAYAWRARAAKNMPALAMRIFALREVAYPGYGFHWNMERRLGSIMMHLNDYDTPLSVVGQIGVEVALEGLYADAAKAEASVNKEAVQ